ncbi:hypothetical protein KUTeg_014775 [Tegillarca granosa]|uniref:GPI ethanolamine phosphate transferase 2 C-terminal domain-containing protein n=1 Tax=Tegillarca granosa TaxID=220873 RepID=A0ABQ9ER00_TEGGR|nr:hypothetical protein KUTeg_014775 [Tegillarca granosa]
MVQVVKAFIVDCSTSMGVNEARLGFIMIAIFMLLSFLTLLKQKREKKQKNISLEFIVTLHKSWILLMTLLVRPHSIPMVAIITIQEYIISRYISRNMQLPITFLTLYYLWMGKASYFYQGNSNSISTVDVSAGYIGLDDYQPVIVAVLLCLSTYAGIVFWLLSNNNHNTRFPGLWRYDIKIRNMTSLNNRFVCSHVISYSPTVENIFENKNGDKFIYQEMECCKTDLVQNILLEVLPILSWDQFPTKKEKHLVRFKNSRLRSTPSETARDDVLLLCVLRKE